MAAPKAVKATITSIDTPLSPAGGDMIAKPIANPPKNKAACVTPYIIWFALVSWLEASPNHPTDTKGNIIPVMKKTFLVVGFPSPKFRNGDLTLGISEIVTKTPDVNAINNSDISTLLL